MPVRGIQCLLLFLKHSAICLQNEKTMSTCIKKFDTMKNIIFRLRRMKSLSLAYFNQLGLVGVLHFRVPV